MSKRYLAVFAVGMLALVLVLPLSSGQTQVAVAAPLVSSSTRFRVVIAEALSANANIYLDGVIVNVNPAPIPTPTPTPVATPIPSPVVVSPFNASGYVTTTAGPHTVSLTQAGTVTAFSGISPFSFSPVAGTNYTLVLLPGNSWITIVDVNTAPPLGMANARVVNLSSVNNPVTVDIDGVAPVEFTNVPYQTTNSTTSTYANIDLTVTATHLLTIPGSNAKAKSYTFLANHVYSIFIFNNTTTLLTEILPKSDASIVVPATVVPTSTTAPTSTTTPTAVITPTLVGTPPPGGALFLPLVER